MAFYFGLNINRNMTDIDNAADSLKNIALDLKDLEKIKGVTDPGNVSRSDFRSLSGLNTDLEKTAGSLLSETNTYNTLTTNFYDELSVIDNDLIINGQFASTAIKFKFLDSANTVRTGDISTSRVSAWSSFSNDAGAPITYGGQVDLEGSLELSDLTILSNAEARRFESEIPTHRVEIDVNGEKIYLLAMKGIPLKFRGFFRNATNLFATVSVLNGLRPSWIIKNVDNGVEYVYQNQLVSSNSQITFRDTQARQRDVIFYYPIDNITNLTLPSLNLAEFPEAILPNLSTLNISNNDFREIPNLSNFTSLQNLSIENNDFTRSSNTNLKTFSSQVVARLPTSLRNLSAGNCFSGTSTADLSSFNLINLNLDAVSRYNRRLSGISPAVNSSTIETYNIGTNLFTNIHSSVKTSTSLKNIILDYNSFTNSDMFFDSSNLEIFSSVDNDHNLVDLSGKEKLKSYTFIYATITAGNKTATNIFNGCAALQTINLYGSTIEGAFPQFVGCNALATIDFRFTRVTNSFPAIGGNPAYVIGENTFDACRSTLNNVSIRSPNFTAAAEFHPDCFRLMSALSYVEISSDNRGITGNIPDFSTARNLLYVLLYNNKLTGIIPNFSNNDKIFFINLSNNSLTGNVPNVPHPSLQHLILTNNQLDTFEKIDSTGVIRIHLEYNKIERIPDLSNLTNLQELLINNQRLPSGSSLRYIAGSFIGLRAIRNMNLANNAITQGTIDQIILDLSTNYDRNPRRNVVVNLRGNSSPSNTEDVQSAIVKLQSVGWRVIYDL